MNRGATRTGESAARLQDLIGNQSKKNLEKNTYADLLDLQQPAIDAGVSVLPQLQESAQIGGILAPVQGLGPLEEIRTGAAQGYADRVGLNRPNAAGRAGQLSASQKLSIEDELNRRRQGIAGIGFTGAGVQSGAMSGLADLTQARSQLRAQQRANSSQNTANMLGSLIGLAGTGAQAGWFGGGGAAAPQMDASGINLTNYGGYV